MIQPTLEDLETIARQAGALLMMGYGRENRVMYKSLIDLVTEMDHRSEEFIIREIRARFPSHYIIAEESGAEGRDTRHAWYIDPIDGTVNYAHSIPNFAVSIAYEYNGVLQLGAVYAPVMDECFTGEKGRGAWLNGAPIQVSTAGDLDHSLLATGFHYQIRKDPLNLNYHARFALRTQGVRRLGSSSLDTCYVAAGRFDAYWELSVNPWDVAAGVVIAREAGAVVSGTDGRPFTTKPPVSILVGTPVIHGLVLAGLLEPLTDTLKI